MITDAGQVLDAAATDQDHGVLLKVMAFTRNVTNDLDARADAALLRAGFHVARFLAVDWLYPGLPDQLLYRRHSPNPDFAAHPQAKCAKQTCQVREVRP